MEMTETLRLNEGIADIRLGEFYTAKVISESIVALNQKTHAKLRNPTELPKGSSILVKATKVSLPDSIDVELMGMHKEEQKDFMIKSEILERLKPAMERAADMVKQAVAEQRPIILKHHGDCDGYMSAIPVEVAINNIITRSKKESAWRYFRRMPSRTPYYDYIDALKDITNYYKEIEAGNPPLLIILDSGSSEQDVLALRKLRLYSIGIIIVDHHKIAMKDSKGMVEPLCDVFVNPHNVGGDSNLTAGMLGCELSRMISEDVHSLGFEFMAAISGISDKSVGMEMDDYLALALMRGYDKETLTRMAYCIDFEAFHIGFMESKLIEDLVSSDMEQIRAKTDIMMEEIKKREIETITTLGKFSAMERIKDIDIVSAEITGLLDQGSYPPQGKALGIYFDSIKGRGRVFAMGIGNGSVTIRTNIPGFDLTVMIEEMKRELDHAQIEGGGHAVAGTIHFIQAAKPDVIGFIKMYLGR
jgi:archaea-specific RecJ-like exonuclease